MPEQYPTLPVSSHPAPLRMAGPIGAATAAQRMSPSPKISSCACSGHHEPIWSAWAAASAMHQPAEMSPRDSSWTTRMNVDAPNS